MLKSLKSSILQGKKDLILGYYKSLVFRQIRERRWYIYTQQKQIRDIMFILSPIMWLYVYTKFSRFYNAVKT